MLRYFWTRILAFIPTLLVISLVAFGLSRITPGDPVECGYTGLSEMDLGTAAERNNFKRIYRAAAAEQGLDQPYFYFTFTSAAYPDTLYRILDRFERESLRKLIGQYGNWPQISNYHQQILNLENALFALPKEESRDAQIELLRNLLQLKISFLPNNTNALTQGVFEVIRQDSLLNSQLAEHSTAMSQAYKKMTTETTPGRLYVPTFYWHGFKNQYHTWISRFLVGDFGRSCRNGQPVFDKIKTALWWTLVLSIPSLLLAFLIAIPVGVYAAVKRNSWFDRISTISLFILYSLPSFWVATILIVFFTTKEYGSFLDIFPGVGLGDLRSSAPLWDRFWESASHLILPIFCMTYATLAFISRQMRTGVIDILQQDFIRSAKAKGLGSSQVIWKHVFRNALFPLISMIALVLPNLIAGSVVIEMIFNIPGMGRETIEAIFARDWPVVYTILLLGAFLTLLGNLLGDFLYAWADPRVTYHTNS